VREGHWNIFASNAHSDQTGLFDQFNINSAPQSPQQLWKGYLNKTNNKLIGFKIIPIQAKSQAAPIVPQGIEKLPNKTSSVIVSIVNLVDRLNRKLMRVFLALGLCMFVYGWIRRQKTQPHEVFAIAAGIMLALVVVIPNASIDYDVGRTSQQFLILLALPTVIGGTFLFKLLLRQRLQRFSYHLVGLTFILLLLFVSGFVARFVGGSDPTMLLNNFGNQYDQTYVHNSEVAAADWLKGNQNNRSIVYAGYFSGNRLWLAGMERPMTYNDILPWTIDKHAYVYSGYGETVNGLATVYYSGSFVRYKYPSELLDNTKNVIYNNGQAKIYK
jgi:uncharacterized membrane protein